VRISWRIDRQKSPLHHRDLGIEPDRERRKFCIRICGICTWAWCYIDVIRHPITSIAQTIFVLATRANLVRDGWLWSVQFFDPKFPGLFGQVRPKRVAPPPIQGISSAVEGSGASMGNDLK
jgi:hypothetical protein